MALFGCGRRETRHERTGMNAAYRGKTSAAALFAFAAALAVSAARDAAACGGCFPSISGSQSEATQVSGHRMILSVYPTSTSLWDQIEYVGSPESFAWVLPIKGTVQVGLSSDALFQVLEQTTQVTVTVYYDCEYDCGGGGTGGGGGGWEPGTAGGPDGGPVTVLDQSVVGPYESAQISSADPQAIVDWLTSHGYNIPADIQPIIESYVQEGFGFLALKLVPGKGVQSMRPVRVTIPGASPVLPPAARARRREAIPIGGRPPLRRLSP
jgi:hypothetical protein